MCLTVRERSNANEGNKKIYSKHYRRCDEAKSNETADVVQSQSYNAYSDKEQTRLAITYVT